MVAVVLFFTSEVVIVNWLAFALAGEKRCWIKVLGTGLLLGAGLGLVQVLVGEIFAEFNTLIYAVILVALFHQARVLSTREAIITVSISVSIYLVVEYISLTLINQFVLATGVAYAAMPLLSVMPQILLCLAIILVIKRNRLSLFVWDGGVLQGQGSVYFQGAIMVFGLHLFGMVLLLRRVFGLPHPYHGPLYFPPEYGALVGLGVLALSLVSIFFIRNLYVDNYKSQQRELEIIRLRGIEEQNRIHRQHQHDLHNHLQVISGLAKLGKIEELNQYLDSYIHNFQRSLIKVDTGCMAMDVLLLAKLSEARGKGLEVAYHWRTKIKCKWGKVLLTSLLANAMDNAIEAGQQAKDKKELQVYVSQQQRNYVFEIVNTYNTDIDLKNKLHRRFRARHRGQGEGVGIIYQTTRLLKGNLKYSVIDDVCKLRVEIPKNVLAGRPAGVR